MSREWKPGDVAVATHPIRNGLVRGIIDTDGRFYTTDQSCVGISSSAFAPDNLRPLVVIDPEDLEQVEQLRVDLINSGWIPDGDADALDSILRRVANPTPPKPEEPQGLGAVVEDEQGNLWVRTDRAAPWSPIRGIGGHSATRRLWSEFTAVRILSPGVEVDQ